MKLQVLTASQKLRNKIQNICIHFLVIFTLIYFLIGYLTNSNLNFQIIALFYFLSIFSILAVGILNLVFKNSIELNLGDIDTVILNSKHSPDSINSPDLIHYSNNFITFNNKPIIEIDNKTAFQIVNNRTVELEILNKHSSSEYLVQSLLKIMRSFSDFFMYSGMN